MPREVIYTKEAYNILFKKPFENRNSKTESIDIAISILKSENTIAFYILSLLGINYDVLIAAIKDTNITTKVTYVDERKEIIQGALYEAQKLNERVVSPEHILLSMLNNKRLKACLMLCKLGIDKKYIEAIIKSVCVNNNTAYEESAKDNEMIYKEMNDYNKDTVIDLYTTDLTKAASEGRLDPVFCRDKEIERLISILLRRTKNNPCLIGEAGVGKTAVVEALAQRIAAQNVPKHLLNYKILFFDISSVLAGSKYRGEFEERIREVIKEVKKNPRTIIFIDEIHTIVGTGSSEGALDAANILKPLLAKGNIKVIGTTTVKEYKKYIQKDPALERRFQPITVNEPTKEQTLLILRGLRKKYEDFHNIVIEEDALSAAIDFSDKYIHNRYRPDKAIDLIDETAATKKLRCDYNNDDTLIPQIINKEDIVRTLSELMDIPLSSINSERRNYSKEIEEAIKQRIIGQDPAVSAVVNAVKRMQSGLSDPVKPCGVFMFCGPSGVGKTELCKVLAKIVYGSDESLIRFDMSEYMEKFNVSKLIGSPPGYVGFEEGGLLTEAVKRKPYSVVLFDEIEKADKDIYNILLQIMDEGRLTDSNGSVSDFRNTIIVLTSNIGSEFMDLKNTFGFNDIFEDTQKLKSIKLDVGKQIRSVFRPEFVNRLDEIIVFNPLNKTDMRKIADKLMDSLIQRASRNGTDLTYDEKVLDYIVFKNTQTEYGARPIKRIIQNEIENKLSDYILSTLTNRIQITADNEKIIFNNY